VTADHGRDMYEWFLENLLALLGIVTIAGGSIYGGVKVFNKKVSNAYEKGKAEEACLKRIEGKADDAIEGLGEVKISLNKETEKAHEQHERIYDKLDTQDNKISDIQTNVSYIKGLLEPKN